ncbi:MAG TPA: LpxI family protein [Alphaproteobacteria bacterium]|nr:LpxI family protein [Alphaproteobacteria bacterium]
MTERLSLIAGSGALVEEVVAAARGRGYELQVLSPNRALRGIPSVAFRLSDPQSVVNAIREFGATIVAMAGGVSLGDIAREGLARFLGAPSATTLGDGGLSVLALRLAEMTGARLVGVHEIAPHLLAPEGLIGGPAPDDAIIAEATFALGLARRAGTLDLGQAMVTAGRRAIAAEDIAGTDALLKRIQTYRAFGMVGGGKASLILAKAAKPTQPAFADLPAIGPVTVAKSKRAGVRVIVVQAGATILIQRGKLAEAADAAKITVIGLPARDE